MLRVVVSAFAGVSLIMIVGLLVYGLTGGGVLPLGLAAVWFIASVLVLGAIYRGLVRS